MIFTVDVIEIVAAAELYYDKKQPGISICIHDNHIVILALCIACLGFLYGSRDFSGYMEITARRRDYFEGFFIWSLLLCFGSMFIDRLISIVAGSMVLNMTGIPGTLLAGTNCRQEVLIFFICLQWGFAIGALYYRMTIKSFFCLMAFILFALCHMFITTYLTNSPHKTLLKDMVLSITQPGIVQGCMAVSLMVIGSLLLRNAGIKQYAHDRL